MLAAIKKPRLGEIARSLPLLLLGCGEPPRGVETPVHLSCPSLPKSPESHRLALALLCCTPLLVVSTFLVAPLANASDTIRAGSVSPVNSSSSPSDVDSRNIRDGISEVKPPPTPLPRCPPPPSLSRCHTPSPSAAVLRRNPPDFPDRLFLRLSEDELEAVRPREGSGVVRRGEPLRVGDESRFCTREGARVESVDGREGVCRVCGGDIWGGGGRCLFVLVKVVSVLEREEGLRIPRANLQDRSVLSAAAAGIPCTAHVLPLLRTATNAHLVSTAVRSPTLAVGRAVSLAGSLRRWEMEVFRDSGSGFGIRDPSQACALLAVRCCVWRSVGVPPLLSMLGGGGGLVMSGLSNGAGGQSRGPGILAPSACVRWPDAGLHTLQRLVSDLLCAGAAIQRPRNQRVFDTRLFYSTPLGKGKQPERRHQCALSRSNHLGL